MTSTDNITWSKIITPSIIGNYSFLFNVSDGYYYNDTISNASMIYTANTPSVTPPAGGGGGSPTPTTTTYLIETIPVNLSLNIYISITKSGEIRIINKDTKDIFADISSQSILPIKFQQNGVTVDSLTNITIPKSEGLIGNYIILRYEIKDNGVLGNYTGKILIKSGGAIIGEVPVNIIVKSNPFSNLVGQDSLLIKPFWSQDICFNEACSSKLPISLNVLTILIIIIIIAGIIIYFVVRG
jgi:hypothetical protein